MLVLGRRFAFERQRGFAWWSIATGAVFFLAFAGVASGVKSSAVMLMFYVAVAWLWLWHASVHLRVGAGALSG